MQEDKKAAALNIAADEINGAIDQQISNQIDGHMRECGIPDDCEFHIVLTHKQIVNLNKSICDYQSCAALQQSDIHDILHHEVHKIPMPKEMCERIAYITVTKDKEGRLGYSQSGMLPYSDVVKAIPGLKSDDGELVKALESLILFTVPKPSNAAALSNAYTVLAKHKAKVKG